MSRIRSKDTRPEKKVRHALHALGFRYRLHRANLPGHPDLVFPKAKVAIFVHGCFWHMHKCRFGRVVPQSNADFWANKRKANVSRDRKNTLSLRKLGWKTLTVWECSCRNSKLFGRQMKRIISHLPDRNSKMLE
jgi:DNA mismatch endonuclease (patch repair protein)